MRGGGDVIGVATVVDRATGAAEAIEAEGLPYRSVLGLADLGLELGRRGTVRSLVAVWWRCLAVFLAGCSGSNQPVDPYGAQGARLGESLALLGWNMSVSNLRWDGDYVLVDIDASPGPASEPHAKAEDIRFGLYGAGAPDGGQRLGQLRHRDDQRA